MTKGELDKLLNEFGAYWSGWTKASSDVDRASCQEGMEKISETIWADMELSMPESFDDLVKIHGKDVVRDWLKAMLK